MGISWTTHCASSEAERVKTEILSMLEMVGWPKITPLLIFKRKTMQKDNIPPGIIIHGHPVGWLDEDGVKH